MALDEIRFPVGISRGASMGPGHRTTFIELPDSGAEERVSHWAGGRCRYDAAMGVKTDADIAAILTFNRCRSGGARGFRWKDWSDFTTASNHRSAHAFDDVTIGFGDGVTTTFQLKKVYDDGVRTISRVLQKPVSGAVKVGVGGLEVAASGNWSVDTTTGVVTFNVAPALDEVVTAGCEFDVPARFDQAADQWFAIVVSVPDVNDLPSLPVIELLNEQPVDEDLMHGGGTTWNPMTANLSITALHGRALVVNPNAGSLTITLPNPAALEPGPDWFYITNLSGTQTVALLDHNAATVATLAVSSTLTVHLGIDAALTKAWYAF